jgi:hypothetical protein
MANVNALLAATGMSYVAASDTSASSADACAYCYGNSVPQAGWVAGHPISANVKLVGAFHGRTVSPGDGLVVAQTTDGVLGATKELDAGRVFMFHDEWVTYNSQWTGVGLVTDCRFGDPNNACNDKHPSLDYQSAQFWYNAITWVFPNECFVIDDPDIVVEE